MSGVAAVETERAGIERTCSDCGEIGATERHDDCADEEHWFHAACWRAFRRWLNGIDDVEDAADPAGVGGAT